MNREALIKAACRPYLVPAMSPEEFDVWWSKYGRDGALREQVAVVVDAVLVAQEETSISHAALWAVCRTDDRDYGPYGRADRNGFCDCSCGCRFYAELPWPRGADWGVCTNPASHRAGLLTFEHQGCPQFEAGPDEEEDRLPGRGCAELSGERTPVCAQRVRITALCY